MNKKGGFTLIELLAVIVILAIIAVIAVPIVLNIIDESKDNSTLRSAEMYVKAAELSIANSTLKDIDVPDDEYTIKDGDICLDNACTKKLEVEVNGETPTSGTITITNGNISDLSIVLNDKTIVKNNEGKLVHQIGETIAKGKFSSVCKIAEDSTIEGTNAGAKYICEVKEGTSYTFYVLNSTTTEVNLIMDRNINSDGTPVTEAIAEADSNSGIYNLVEWISESDYGCEGSYCARNDKGPLTSMRFLKEATKTWTNVNEMLIDSFDSYDWYDKTLVKTTKIQIYKTYARMPYFSEVVGYNGTNGYLYEYLDYESWQHGESTKPLNNISGIYGYWTLAADGSFSEGVWFVSPMGYVFGSGGDGGVVFELKGVRPVINLSI